MKLQKVFAYKYGEKNHFKYLITLPGAVIDQLGWKAGGELQLLIEEFSKMHPKEYEKMKQGLPSPPQYRGMLHMVYIADPGQRSKKEPEPKMTYQEFRDTIQKELKKNPDGLTWTELKGKLKLPQKVPNNKWVNQMEKDIGMIRVKKARGIVWKLKLDA